MRQGKVNSSKTTSAKRADVRRPPRRRRSFPSASLRAREYGDDILSTDSGKVQEIANYMHQNPSMRVAIDGSNERRVSNVRDALINAGVPAYKIQTGAFGDPQLRQNSRVGVLVSSN